MITLTEEELFEFIKCPARYDAIYNGSMVPTEKVTVSSLLSTVSQFFFSGLMEGKVRTTNELKRKWDKICEDNQSFMTGQMCLEGMGQIMRMYHWAHGEELMIADIGSTYGFHVENGEKRVFFQGKMGAISFTKAKEPCLLDLDWKKQTPLQPMIDMKLKYTLDAYAALNIYGKSLGIKVHHVKGDKDYYTSRREEDFNRMRAAIISVAKSKELKLFYPRESALCTSCDLINYCKLWKLPMRKD